MNPTRRALAGAALAAAVLLGTVGVAGAQSSQTTGPRSDAEAIATLNRAQADITAVRGYLAGKQTTTPTTTTTQPAPSSTPPPTSTTSAPAATTAAERFGWGKPIDGSDEFDYTGAPDPKKWNVAGQCWAGHAGNGKRCADRSTVANGILTQTGLTNGDTGWLASKVEQRYGRWEARVRSSDAGQNQYRYHPLLIIWPTSNRWPQDGEYDFLENGAPGQACAESFIHYPHPAGRPVQQEFTRETDCGAPLSEWHNVAVEWTPQHVKGFIDGKQWFSFSGGAGPQGRSDIQAMPSGHLTIQLDGFHGTGPYRPARYEIDWARIYKVS